MKMLPGHGGRTRGASSSSERGARHNGYRGGSEGQWRRADNGTGGSTSNSGRGSDQNWWRNGPAAGGSASGNWGERRETVSSNGMSVNERVAGRSEDQSGTACTVQHHRDAWVNTQLCMVVCNCMLVPPCSSGLEGQQLVSLFVFGQYEYLLDFLWCWTHVPHPPPLRP